MWDRKSRVVDEWIRRRRKQERGMQLQNSYYYFMIVFVRRCRQGCALLEEKNKKKEDFIRKESEEWYFHHVKWRKKDKRVKINIFMVIISHRRNLYGWKKKRNRSNYVGSEENMIQEDETWQLKKQAKASGDGNILPVNNIGRTCH